jgi:hypothetical protein
VRPADKRWETWTAWEKDERSFAPPDYIEPDSSRQTPSQISIADMVPAPGACQAG